MEIINSIGERLLAVRENMHKTQSDFAEIAASAGVPGATRQSQAKYEKGLATPSAAYLAAIAAAGADVLYILTGIDAAAHARLAMLGHAIGQAGQRTDSFEETKRLGTALNTQMQASTARVTPRERTLLDNYRAADESGKKLIEGTAALAAQADKRKKA